jgi:hypothetical protein
VFVCAFGYSGSPHQDNSKAIFRKRQHWKYRVDRVGERPLDEIMPQTTHRKQNRQSAAAHLALTSRVLKGLNKSIDEQIELACELECERALALYRTGKVTLHDADVIMKEARQRIG